MIADMNNNKKLNPVVTELFIRDRKLGISIVFITQSYFKVPKDVRINSTHFFIMKISSKRELQQTALNHSSDIDFKDFMKIIKDKKEQTKETKKQLDKYSDMKKGNLSINKQWEIFNELIKKRRETMLELDSSVKFDNLLYHYKGSTEDKDFSMYNDAKVFLI